MPLYKNRSFLVAGTALFLLFAALLAVRLGFFRKGLPDYAFNPVQGISERDSWMNIIQGGRKIGFSHSVLSKNEAGYNLRENVFMKINTMGMIQDINLNTQANLNPDFTLRTFDFGISSGRFEFKATGKVSGEILSIHTQDSGTPRKIDIPVRKRPYIVAGLVDAALAAGLKEGEHISFNIFDPATMSQEPVIVKAVGKQEISIGGISQTAVKMLLSFKGTTQNLWIGESGEVLKEEGILGISLEKTTREEALSGLSLEASEDLTKIASLASNVIIDNPETLSLLKVKIEGVELEPLKMNSERQTFENMVLEIKKESLIGLTVNENLNKNDIKWLYFLKPTPFIQSDNRKILNVVLNTVNPSDPPLIKTRKIMNWINSNIQKRPVVSLPDAVSTLENGEGDCNEHAVLMAALARAAGIPAKIEAGLVYLNGRFYYHAWNLLYLG
ncbi:MAG: transglutaminase-like domain-containing protein, partial [Proteobacteria bacterium]|nr:transglutaminase-like domain-containing protein [Pseudomonadota bacterium]